MSAGLEPACRDSNTSRRATYSQHSWQSEKESEGQANERVGRSADFDGVWPVRYSAKSSCGKQAAESRHQSGGGFQRCQANCGLNSPGREKSKAVDMEISEWMSEKGGIASRRKARRQLKTDVGTKREEYSSSEADGGEMVRWN